MRVQSNFGRWQRKYQPAASNVYIWQLDYVLEELPVGLCIIGVYDDVCAVKHRILLK